MKERYLRMIAGMKTDGLREWAVYILRCGDGSLYTGIAKNVEDRLRKHRQGKGAAYTRTHLPVHLVHQEDNMTRSQALVREACLKRISKKSKEQFLMQQKERIHANGRKKHRV